MSTTTAATDSITSRSSTIDTTVSNKKRVTFSGKVRAKKTLHVNSYTMQEIHSTWYDADDLDKIRQRVKVATNEAREMSLSDLRGLENWSSKGLKRVRQRRSKSTSLVLREQEKQRGIESSTVDKKVQAIAEIYSKYCLPSQVEARMMGVMDEKEVKMTSEQQHQRGGTPSALATVVSNKKRNSKEFNMNKSRPTLPKKLPSMILGSSSVPPMVKPVNNKQGMINDGIKIVNTALSIAAIGGGNNVTRKTSPCNPVA